MNGSDRRARVWTTKQSPKRKPGLRRAVPAGVAFALYLAIAPHAAQAQSARFDSPPRDFDFLHMRWEVTLTQADIEARRLHGVVTYRVQPSATAAENISGDTTGRTPLRLDAVDLDVQCVELSDAAEAPSWHAAEYEANGAQLIIDLDRPRKPAEEFFVRVGYTVTNPPRGLFFVLPDENRPERPPTVYTNAEPLQARHWLPCHDWPDTRWPSDVFITVPQPLTAISVGELVDVPEPARVPASAPGAETSTAERLWTFHWRLEVPTDPHLLGFAVGQFSIVPLDRPAPAGSPRGPRCYAYVERPYELAARYTFRRAPDIVAFYSKLLGVDYPYPECNFVSIANHFHGGMEHAGFNMLDPAMLTTGNRGDVPEDISQYNYVAHMLAHAWFAGLVNYRHLKEAWLNEGFATYLHLLWWSQADSPDAFVDQMSAVARGLCAHDRVGVGRPMVRDDLTLPEEVYFTDGGKAYWKGAWILHMLRRQLGDETFWKATRSYLERHRAGSVVTADLERTFAEVSGQDLKPFFDQWVRRGGVPELEVEYRWDAERSRAAVTIRQKQLIDGDYPPFTFPLDLYFRTRADGIEKTVPVAGESQTYEFPLDVEPELFCLDPRCELLADIASNKPRELWLRQVRGGPTAHARVLAIEHLRGEKDQTPPVTLLRAALLDKQEYWGVRQRAAETLGAAESDEAAEALLTVARGEAEHPRVLATVVEALGHYPESADAHAALLAHADNDEHILVQAAAVRSLRHFSSDVCDDQTLAALTAAAAPGVSYYVRDAALDSLELIGSPAALQGLLPALVPNHDDAPPIYCRLIMLVAELAAKEATCPPGVIDCLEKLQTDRRPMVREAARAALDRLRPPGAEKK